MSEVREKLAQEIMEADWLLLDAHYARDAVIIVEDKLELLDAAEAVAKDHIDQIKGWLKEMSMYKPRPDQVVEWEARKTKFKFIIVQPYVLAQQLRQ